MNQSLWTEESDESSLVGEQGDETRTRHTHVQHSANADDGVGAIP